MLCPINTCQLQKLNSDSPGILLPYYILVLFHIVKDKRSKEYMAVPGLSAWLQAKAIVCEIKTVFHSEGI